MYSLRGVAISGTWVYSVQIVLDGRRKMLWYVIDEMADISPNLTLYSQEHLEGIPTADILKSVFTTLNHQALAIGRAADVIKDATETVWCMQKQYAKGAVQ